MKTEVYESSASNAGNENLVYIRRLARDEAQRIVPADRYASITEPDDLFSVHDSDGQRLAVVEGREAAFAAARAHDLRPRSVH